MPFHLPTIPAKGEGQSLRQLDIDASREQQSCLLNLPLESLRSPLQQQQCDQHFAGELVLQKILNHFIQNLNCIGPRACQQTIQVPNVLAPTR